MRHEKTLKKLVDRSYNSYLARVNTMKRLKAAAHWWTAAQISLSGALLSVSIALLGLQQNGLSFEMSLASAISLAVLSVLALVVSIVSSNLDFSSRAQEMFKNYRSIQAYSAKIELLMDTHARVSRHTLTSLSNEYQQLLDNAENHSNRDYHVAKTPTGPWGLPVGIIVAAGRDYAIPAALVAGSVAMVVATIVQVFAVLLA